MEFNNLVIHAITTPIGDMIASFHENRLCLLEFVDRIGLDKQIKRIKKYRSSKSHTMGLVQIDEVQGKCKTKIRSVYRIHENLREHLTPQITICTSPTIDHPMLNKFTTQLQEYFAGKRQKFSILLVTSGTIFQQKVWQSLQEIPYGDTQSYKQQAINIQKDQAVRAVASANAANSIAIIIPCHRVISANGKMAGYAGGLWRKKYLLQLEKN